MDKDIYLLLGFQHSATWRPCLQIGDTWIWWRDYSMDKELAVGMQTESCGQWFCVQVEASDESRPLWLSLGIIPLQYLHWWQTVRSTAASAGLVIGSWALQLTQQKKGMTPGGSWTSLGSASIRILRTSASPSARCCIWVGKIPNMSSDW